jgi:hypothetical protein
VVQRGGVHGESNSGLIEARAAVRRPGDGGEETVEEALIREAVL